MRGNRARLNADEQDAFTGWKRLLCVFRKPGISKRTKQRFHRKQRLRGKQEIRRELSDA